MIHINHSVALVYVHELGELEVGTVAVVPRKGEVVSLLVQGQRRAYHVEQVTWEVNDDTCEPADLLYGRRFTCVRVALSRCA